MESQSDNVIFNKPFAVTGLMSNGEVVFLNSFDTEEEAISLAEKLKTVGFVFHSIQVSIQLAFKNNDSNAFYVFGYGRTKNVRPS